MRDCSKSAWISSVVQLLSYLKDVEKMLTSLHHNRISPKRLLQFLRCCRKFAEVNVKFVATDNDNDNDMNGCSSSSGRRSSASVKCNASPIGISCKDTGDISNTRIGNWGLPDLVSDLLDRCNIPQIICRANETLSQVRS